MQKQPHAEMIRHGRRALIFFIAFAILFVSVIYSVFNSLSPEGTYVYAYEISADGKKETGRSRAFAEFFVHGRIYGKLAVSAHGKI